MTFRAGQRVRRMRRADFSATEGLDWAPQSGAIYTVDAVVTALDPITIEPALWLILRQLGTGPSEAKPMFRAEFFEPLEEQELQRLSAAVVAPAEPFEARPSLFERLRGYGAAFSRWGFR